MSTLLIRLAAPMQSWGVDSNFITRRTEREPSKSGVIGLCASALGLQRSDDISHLAKLKFGVRTDRQGELLIDFQTAKEEGVKDKTTISYRHYLADAVFTVGLEGDDELLAEIEQALWSPAYPLFLGRRCCPPTLPLSLGMTELPLLDALRDGSPDAKILMDTEGVSHIRRRDIPVSFSQAERKYEFRYLKEC